MKTTVLRLIDVAIGMLGRAREAIATGDTPTTLEGVWVVGLTYDIVFWSARAWAAERAKPTGAFAMEGGNFILLRPDHVANAAFIDERIEEDKARERATYDRGFEDGRRSARLIA